MRLVHYTATGSDTESRGNNTESDGRSNADATKTGETGVERDVLATNVDLAESLLSQSRGLMFRRSLADDYALAFRFDTAKTRDVHMLFVFVPIDAVWVVDDIVQRVERLRPWRSFARENCDLLVELPAGAAATVEPGDRLVLESS